jgi:hypothetical protein
MDDQKTVRVGIGFATGRKSFQKVLRTYLYNCWESGLTEKENTQLNLLVAYDVKYLNTKPTDYTNVSRELSTSSTKPTSSAAAPSIGRSTGL